MTSPKPALSARPDSITIRRPDDWHFHLRDGEILRQVLPHTARQFARGIVMGWWRQPRPRGLGRCKYSDRHSDRTRLRCALADAVTYAIPFTGSIGQISLHRGF